MTAEEVRASFVERLKTLSQIELSVMHSFLEGRTQKEIAFEMRVSERSIQLWQARLREKMNARTSAQLVRNFLIAKGFVELKVVLESNGDQY